LAVVLIHPGNRGIPVFFLHGIGGSIYFWTPELTSPFQTVGACYSLSLPGHFPAVFPKDFAVGCLTPELIARLVSSAIRKLAGNKKVLLVGHSTGGFAALSTAIYNPEVVAGVVSMEGFAKGQWTGALGFNQWLVRQGPIGRAIFKMVYRFGKYPALFRMFWQVYANDHISLWKNPCFDAVVKSSFPYLQKLDLDALADYFTIMPRTDITPCLSKIRVPTCLIAGDQDPIVPPRQSTVIAENVANASLVILKGSGHLPFFERPVEYKKAIDTWLTEFQLSS
jgi:pimeloyl-ACP methyl ester carboxylesterase